MLIRILIVLALVAGAFFGVQKVLGPKRLRVPFIWRSVAGRHPDVQQALDQRTAIATLLIDEPDAKFEPVMREIDGVIATLVKLARARDITGAPPSETEALALQELGGLQRQIRDETHAEAGAEVDRLRARLGERAIDLRQTLAARRELDRQ